MKTGTLLLGACLTCCCVAGCQNTVNTVENEEKSMTPETITDKRFITDGYLRDRLQLKSLDVAESADGIKRVQLTAINMRVGFFSEMWSSMTGSNPYRIQYKFTWLDKDGMAVTSVMSGWQAISVKPGETIHLQSSAPNKTCKDFIVNLQEAE